VRQSTIFKESSLVLGEHEKTFAEAYSYDSSPFMNDFLRCGREKNYPDGYFPKEANIPGDSLSRVVQFIDIVNMLPSAGDVTLYRGGTSGEIFRMGSVKVGDVLCNTDFASFTESPHIAKEFSFFRNDDEYYFSDGSIIYILDKHKSAKAFAPLSIRSEEPYFEAESLIPPGKFFKVTGVGEKNALLSGKNQTYIEVLIHEIESLKPKVANSITLSSAIEFPDHVYDLKTGERIDIEVWSSRLGSGSDKCIAWS
jgi:hypothetical protein